MDVTKNKVVLIGGDHHNGLGLVRTFGVNGIKPYGIIIEERSKRSFISFSKYWEKVWLVKNEDDALKILRENFLHEKYKTVIIPYSDSAAVLVDSNLLELNKRYICPSINNESGKIIELMNKQDQVKYADTHGFEMLPSLILQLDETSEKSIFMYPVILKPVASIEGEKLDITICNNQDELQRALDKFRKLEYSRVLVQKYLEKKREYVLTGAVGEQEVSYNIVRHIRQWPANKGSGSFSEFAIEENVNEYACNIMKKMQKSGFCGVCDVEFFEDEAGKFYLNEINWRSSGRNFVSLYTEVYSTYAYYCWRTKLPFEGEFVNRKQGFSMNEWTDFRHVFKGNIKFFNWLKDVARTDNYALWMKEDKKPFLDRIIKLLYK